MTSVNSLKELHLTDEDKKVIKHNRTYGFLEQWKKIIPCRWLIYFDDDDLELHEMWRLRLSVGATNGIHPQILCVTTKEDNSEIVNTLQQYVITAGEVCGLRLSEEEFAKCKDEMFG